MGHETNLLTLLAAGLVLAFVLGAIALRLKLSPLVGYLVAGMLVGPFTPGYEADTGLAMQLGEIGVVLLMFGLGLSVASTVVMLRALEEHRIVETRRGKAAIGWLIVEDLVMVLVLVLLP